MRLRKIKSKERDILMKKLISLFLAVLMIASVVAMIPVFTVSAEEAAPETVTEIANTEKFIEIFSGKTVEGGYYKLTASINLVGTDYTAGTFTGGTLDGDTNTVTTDKTLFTSLSATVKNLTVDGSITVSTAIQGTIANTAGNGITFENVVSNVNLSHDGNTNTAIKDKFYLGGFIGLINAANGTTSFKNCLYSGNVSVTKHSTSTFIGGLTGLLSHTSNSVIDGFAMSGTITVTTTTFGGVGMGGIAGLFEADPRDDTEENMENITIKNCTISGDFSIKNPKSESFMGGIVGRTQSTTNLIIDACTVTSTSDFLFTQTNKTQINVGGIAAQIGVNTAENTTIRNTTVAGKISAGNTSHSYTTRMGSFVGYYYCASGTVSLLENCTFIGTITHTGKNAEPTLGGFIGVMCATADTKLSNCVMAGTITSTSTKYGSFIKHTKDAVSGTDTGTNATPPMENCISLTDNATLIYNQASYTGTSNCYTMDQITPSGNPITIGDVTYQKYNFGYLNETTKQIVSDAQELSATVDDSIKGYIQIRDNGDMHDVRVIFVINAETVVAKGTVVTITFTKDGETVKTFTATLGGEGSDFEVFRAGIAAGTPFFAAEDCEMFGAVVTGIPDGEWDTVTATIVSEETELFNKGTNYAE